MELVLELDGVTMALAAADDTTRLSVRVAGPAGATASSSGHRLGDVLAGLRLGRLVGDVAFLSPEALRFLAAGEVGADWDARFAGMCEYAATKGWADPEDGALQAHVVWPPAPPGLG